MVSSEVSEKVKAYQGHDYEMFLKEKCVLDAKQFLHSSLIYLNYALISAKLYEDIGKENIQKSNKNPSYNSVEILGWHYNAHDILNKCALEWVFHISNSLDCLLQYIRAALALDVNIGDVNKYVILNKIKSIAEVNQAMDDLWNDEIVVYIQSVYNYCKHTLDLYGGSSDLDVISGQRDIHIPDFRFKNNFYKSRAVSELINYYDAFYLKYVAVLDSIDQQLRNSAPIQNRIYIGAVNINNHILGKIENVTDITINAELAEDGEHIARFWIENPLFNYQQKMEIMPIHNKSIGQHTGFISKIEIIQNGKVKGYLEVDSSNITSSVLAYHKYSFKKI